MLSADTVSPLTDASIKAVGAVQLRPHRILAHPKAGTGNEHKTPSLAFFPSTMEMHVHASRSQSSAL